jgi:Uma2 family endonuclease
LFHVKHATLEPLQQPGVSLNLKTMSVLAKQKMTVDEFLAWAEGREGRWELADGVPVCMSPERVAHGETKFSAGSALKNAIRKASLQCEAFIDCLAIRVDQYKTFQPDIVINCGERLKPAVIEAPNPVIVVEILSPSTRAIDLGLKVRRYFELPSIHHYLILDADNRSIVHYARDGGDTLLTRIVSAGELTLDPPGFKVEAQSLFPEPYEA